MTAQGVVPGLGHDAVLFLFTSASDHACDLRGYPGVDGVTVEGQIAHATRIVHGWFGGDTSTTTPPDIHLLPGQSASALVESTDNEVQGRPCLDIGRLLVTPPNTTTTVSLTQPLRDCTGLEVMPVVPGTTGRA